MSNLSARSRIEAWKKETQGVAHLGYKRDSEAGAGGMWTVQIDFRPDGVVDLVAILTSATQLEKACEAAIVSLAEYGVEVP